MWLAGWVECDVEIMQMLVEAGGDATEALKGCMECRNDDTLEAVKYLCRFGDVDARLGDGRTLLHEAAERGNSGFVRALVDADADLAAVDSNGRTPLHLAARETHTEVVRALLELGAPATALDARGRSPRQLMEAEAMPDDERLPELRELLP
jgi:cytohesin